MLHSIKPISPVDIEQEEANRQKNKQTEEINECLRLSYENGYSYLSNSDMERIMGYGFTHDQKNFANKIKPLYEDDWVTYQFYLHGVVFAKRIKTILAWDATPVEDEDLSFPLPNSKWPAEVKAIYEYLESTICKMAETPSESEFLEAFAKFQKAMFNASWHVIDDIKGLSLACLVFQLRPVLSILARRTDKDMVKFVADMPQNYDAFTSIFGNRVRVSNDVSVCNMKNEIVCGILKEYEIDMKPAVPKDWKMFTCCRHTFWAPL